MTTTTNLDGEEIKLFYKLWFSLTHGVNCKHKIVPQYDKPEYSKDTHKGQTFAVRQELWGHPEWIDEFIDDSPDLTEEEEAILTSWRKHFKKGRFLVERHLKKYSVLMSLEEKEETLYGVMGITDPLEITLMEYEPPLIVDTVLLPFKGKIIYDSFIFTYNVYLGSGYRKSFKEKYNEIKAVRGIFDTLDVDISTEEVNPNKRICVNLATLESRIHEVNAIKSGIRLFEAGNATSHRSNGILGFSVEDKNGRRDGSIRFTTDGRDVESFFCGCSVSRDGCLCKHVVAGILSIQGGLPESKIILGKTSTVEEDISESHSLNTAADPNTPATSFLAMLAEKASCEVMNDVLEEGQTSVGTSIAAELTTKRAIGDKLFASAVIGSARGLDLKFNISITDELGEICRGTHTRVIIDKGKTARKAKRN